jgi:transposase InsO family protein
MYIISAIDVESRFGFALAFKRLSSENAKEFMEKFLLVFPYRVKCVQPDNGSEFAGKFDEFLKKRKISHFYIHPKRPQENGFIERFNRTLNEYFIEWNTYDFTAIGEFNKRMIQFLIWYNTIKPHSTLRGFPLLEFILNQLKNKYTGLDFYFNLKQ